MQGYIKTGILFFTKALICLISGVLVLTLILICIYVIEQYDSKSMREWLIGEPPRALLDAKEFGIIPEIRVKLYRFRIKEYKPVDEYQIRLLGDLDSALLHRIDSLCIAEDHKGLSNWEHFPNENYYAYCFFNIAQDCEDTLYIYPDKREMKFIHIEYPRYLRFVHNQD